MLCKQSIPAPTAGVHTNGRSGSLNSARPYRRPRLLYRTGITNIELDALVAEIGIDRVMAALDRATQPELPLEAFLRLLMPYDWPARRTGDCEAA